MAQPDREKEIIIRFGYGKFHPGKDPLHNLSMPNGNALYNRALIAGWSAGCPVAREISDPENSEYGPEYAYKRYVQVNYVFDTAQRMVCCDIGNGKLHKNLLTPISRSYHEGKKEKFDPVGKYEKESVPISHLEQMAPLATPVGYAFPRLLIEQYNRNAQTNNDPHYLLTEMYRSILFSAYYTTDPNEFLINIAKNCYNPREMTEAQALAFYSHLFSTSVLVEENCQRLFDDIANTMDIKAPDLRNAYLQICDSQKHSSGIIMLK